MTLGSKLPLNETEEEENVCTSDLYGLTLHMHSKDRGGLIRNSFFIPFQFLISRCKPPCKNVKKVFIHHNFQSSI